MFGADIGVVEVLRLLRGEREHFLDAGRVRTVAELLGVRTALDLLLDFAADVLQIETHLLQNVDRHALAELEQAQQQVLGADEIVIEAVGFLARERQHLLGARREVVHGFFRHNTSR